MYKSLYKIGFLGYAALFILSIIFYKERTIFTDNAFHLFAIIREGKFAFQNFRYGAAVTQSVPLLGSKLLLSLDTILLLYSACFVAWYSLCYFLCGSVLRNYKLALVLLLFNIIFASDTFFWMLSELPQGVAFMLVIWSAFIKADTEKLKPLFILFAFASTTAILLFFHPLMVFPHFFMIAFFFLHKKDLGGKGIIALAVFSVLSYAIKGLFFVTVYERHSMGISKKMINAFPNYFTGHANEMFFRNCIGKYCWMSIIWLAIVVIYSKQHAWPKLLFFICCTLGYLLFINTTYSDPDIPAFYIENLYLPLGIFLAVPFVFDVLPLYSARVSVTILLILIVTASVRIYKTGDKYVDRLDWERRFLAAYGNEKIMMSTDLVPRDTVILAWATPYEFWLLSTTELGRSASIIIHDSVNTLSWTVNNKASFVTEWGIFNYTDMPDRYFSFTDTVTDYKLIEK